MWNTDLKIHKTNPLLTYIQYTCSGTKNGEIGIGVTQHDTRCLGQNSTTRTGGGTGATRVQPGGPLPSTDG